MRGLNKMLRLNLITDPGLCASLGLLETVQAAVAGGVTMVQLRDKTASTAEMIETSRTLKAALAGSGVPIVINDDLEAALAADADGAHVGQSDQSPEHAREMLGQGKILGLSCETADHVKAANPALVDYLGIGPVFSTDTKSDHAQPIGLSGLASLAALSALPKVAIGGLGASHARGVRAAGVDGLAVISAICGQANPEKSARAFFTDIKEYSV